MEDEPVTASDGDWPVFRIQVEAPPTREIAAMIRSHLDAALARERPHASIVELTRPKIPNPFLVRDQARWFGERAEALAAHCRGIAIVTSSAAMRGVPNAVLRIFTPATPVRAFADVDAARVWCLEQLSDDT